MVSFVFSDTSLFSAETEIPTRHLQHARNTSPGPRSASQRLQHPPESSSRRAGRLSQFYFQWCEVTSNHFVLQIIKFGLKLHFISPPPFMVLSSSPPSPTRAISISSEVSSLLDKTAISVIQPDPEQVVSPIFDVPKKDSSDCRVILNLKILNTFIFKTRFRLEGYDVIINMLRRHDFMVSIDLKDAFLMFSMNVEFHKYLCFEWLGIRYAYQCMPFGLTSAPRIFTKVLKTVLVFLRSRGLRITAWFDDMILMAESVPLLLEQLHFARLTLKSLGFLINEAKSVFVPSQSLLHLGYIWDSVSLSLSVPDDKVRVLKDLCSKALEASTSSLRFLQRILGSVESFRIAYPLAALHYRFLQREVATCISSGLDWDHKISLSSSSRADLEWWLTCDMPLPSRSLAPFRPDITVTSDSSNQGWGAFTSLDEEAFGFWSPEESSLHINVLESLAVLFAFQCFFREVRNVNVLIVSDNYTTVSYINHFGGVRSQAVSSVITDLYSFCQERNLVIKASFLKGRLNLRADALSRRVKDHGYSLPVSLFQHFCNHFCLDPEVDLFASRLNNKLPFYYSRGPDPSSSGFDAFSMDWPNSVYAFPPIMLVDKFLAYFMNHNISEGLVVVPYWPGQSFFPNLLKLISNTPILFSVSHLEGSAQTPRPLRFLLACHISSDPEKRKGYLRSLSQESSEVSISTPSALISEPGKSLSIGVVASKLLTATFL